MKKQNELGNIFTVLTQVEESCTTLHTSLLTLKTLNTRKDKISSMERMMRELKHSIGLMSYSLLLLEICPQRKFLSQTLEKESRIKNIFLVHKSIKFVQANQYKLSPDLSYL